MQTGASKRGGSQNFDEEKAKVLFQVNHFQYILSSILFTMFFSQSYKPKLLISGDFFCQSCILSFVLHLSSIQFLRDSMIVISPQIVMSTLLALDSFPVWG